MLQFLFYLNRKDFQQLLDLTGPFKNYYYRYLKHQAKKEKIALFMKMINKVLAYNKVIKKTRTIIKSLLIPAFTIKEVMKTLKYYL